MIILSLQCKLCIKAGDEAKHTKYSRPGSSGSTTSMQSEASSVQLVAFHDSIPSGAKLPADDVLWVNHKGQVKKREVVGQCVWIRQQPPGLPSNPEILLITDQMMEGFQVPDKYIVPTIRVGYSLQDYTNDIKDSALDLNFPYILVYIRTLQLRMFDSRVVQ